METRRKILIQTLEKRLVPHWTAKGFVLESADGNGNVKWYFPLGVLKRKRGKRIEKFEVQFDKNGKPKFVINLMVSRDGNSKRSFCRLHSRPVGRFSLAWFSLPWVSWPWNDRARAEKTSKLALDLSQEAEDWFRNGTVGPHLMEI